jgi:hypothetical protein
MFWPRSTFAYASSRQGPSIVFARCCSHFIVLARTGDPHVDLPALGRHNCRQGVHKVGCAEQTWLQVSREGVMSMRRGCCRLDAIRQYGITVEPFTPFCSCLSFTDLIFRPFQKTKTSRQLYTDSIVSNRLISEYVSWDWLLAVHYSSDGNRKAAMILSIPASVRNVFEPNFVLIED